MAQESTQDLASRMAILRSFAANYDTSIEEVSRAVRAATEIVGKRPGSSDHFDLLVTSTARQILFKRLLEGV